MQNVAKNLVRSFNEILKNNLAPFNQDLILLYLI